jgi:hypothetical protein
MEKMSGSLLGIHQGQDVTEMGWVIINDVYHVPS